MYYPVYAPVYYPVYYPAYVAYPTPVWCVPSPYRSSLSFTYVSSSVWWGSSAVTSVVVYDPSPKHGFEEFCDWVTEPATVVVYQPSTPRVIEVNVPTYQPTIYRSDELAGLLSFNDTPEAVVGIVGSTPSESRAAAASRFLGRVPAGAWEATYEAERVIDGRQELVFRSLTTDSRGNRVEIVLRPAAPLPVYYAGQRVQLTGRIAELCVDDPYSPAGRIVLADGTVRP